MKMSAWKALAAAACCAGLAAVLLTAFEPETSPPDGRPLAVFRQDRSVRLDSGNLVDLLASVEFRQKIRRVRWTGSALSVDFMVRDGEATAESIYSDLKELIGRTFGHTTNVRRLLVRFETAGDRNQSGRGELLLAADVRRTDPWMAGQWNGLGDADPARDRVWRERLRITTTRLWDERYGGTIPES